MFFFLSDSYMMFNTASYQHAPLDKGQLISPALPHSNYTYCLSFWTYMYSSTAGLPIGGLQVKVHKSDNSTLNLWRLDNHQASHWMQAQISMPEHFNTSDRVSCRMSAGHKNYIKLKYRCKNLLKSRKKNV